MKAPSSFQSLSLHTFAAAPLFPHDLACSAMPWISFTHFCLRVGCPFMQNLIIPETGCSMSVNTRGEGTGQLCSHLPTHCLERAQRALAEGMTEWVTGCWVMQHLSFTRSPEFSPVTNPARASFREGSSHKCLDSPQTTICALPSFPKCAWSAQLSFSGTETNGLDHI